jgi:hypothetical protein
MHDTTTTPKDFLISYNTADQAWAEWIAWQLEAAGYSIHFDAWDVRPGMNFVLEMDRATSSLKVHVCYRTNIVAQQATIAHKPLVCRIHHSFPRWSSQLSSYRYLLVLIIIYLLCIVDVMRLSETTGFAIRVRATSTRPPRPLPTASCRYACVIPTCVQNGNGSYQAFGPGSQNNMIRQNTGWDDRVTRGVICQRV